VRFYTDPRPFPEAVPASVYYAAREGRRVHPIGHDFCQYHQRLSERLLYSARRRWMDGVLTSILESDFHEDFDVLRGPDYAIELVPESGDIKKRCYARFFSDRPAVARFYGGEEYYGPLSVFAFLQCIVDALQPAEKKRLGAYLKQHLEVRP